MNRRIASILFLLWCAPAWTAEPPKLFDFFIEGTGTAPEWESQTLTLQAHHDYLFVVNNSMPLTLDFHFEKLGQHVSTRYLQGSPSVSQESMQILPESKIVWHFTADKAGSFVLSIVNLNTLEKSGPIPVELVGDKVATLESNPSIPSSAFQNESSSEELVKNPPPPKKKREPKPWRKP